jgi:hypothetical protein
MTKPVKPTRHGLNAVKNRVEIRGFRVVDRRSAAAKALFEWRAALFRDLGGEANVSAQKRALVDLAVRTRLYVDHCDAFLMEQPSLILKKRKTVLPILLQRQSLADSLARTLSMLGLDRVPPPHNAELVARARSEIRKLMAEDSDEHDEGDEGNSAA